MPEKEIPVALGVVLSGGAGLFAWLFTHPFEVLKNRIMLDPPGTSSIATTKDAYQKGLFKGLSGGLSRQVTYASCRIGLYEPVRRQIMVVAGHDRPGDKPNVIERALAGAIAGALASFLSSPVEVCLVLQTRSPTKLSLIKAGQSVIANSGVKGFWNGATPLMTRAAVVGVSQVAMYDQISAMTKAYVAAGGPEREKNWGHIKVSIFSSFWTSLFYSMITMPLELARVKMASMQKHMEPGTKKPGMGKVLATVVRTEGFGTVFKSFIPYFARCTTHTCGCFIVLDIVNRRVKQYLNS